MSETIPDRRAGPEQQVSRHEAMDMLLRALSRLPEQDRSALLMRGYEDMSHEEIAEALGVSVMAVKVRIHRARLRLASAMEQLSGGNHECDA
jgi:RNA polymerase sigma-70 factor (ECF subfamily)